MDELLPAIQTSSVRSQSMHGADPRLLNFSRFLKQNQLVGARIGRDKEHGCAKFTPCHFVPFEVIVSYFKDRDTLESLLRCVHGEDESPVDVETVYHGHLRLFCILVRINRGHLIVHCLDARITDFKLPFSSPEEFPSELEDIDEDFRSAFMHQQWYFYPHKFGLHQIDVTYADSLIYPIASTDILDAEYGRTITKLTIHSGHHTLRPPQDPEQGASDRNVFVLKSLDGTENENLRCYQSEVKAFRKLGSNGLPGCPRSPPSEIIRTYGSFKQCGNYHILLEYAEIGTLVDYFKNTLPPQNADELHQFWSSMEAVSIGMSRIHRLLPENESIGVFQGYHQDIKLSNILVFLDQTEPVHKVRFKIADLGLTNFVRGQYYVSNASGQGQPGTRTFGSPESHQSQQYSCGRFKSGQAADIWSLACIFSVAATWAIGGWQLVEQYTKTREQARQKFGKAISDCFHDDEVVLEAVETWHVMLANNAQDFDHVTPQLWYRLLQTAFAPELCRPDALKFQLAFTSLYNTKIEQDRKRSSTVDAQCSSMHYRGSILGTSMWPCDSPNNVSDSNHRGRKRSLGLQRVDTYNGEGNLPAEPAGMHIEPVDRPYEGHPIWSLGSPVELSTSPKLKASNRAYMANNFTPAAAIQSEHRQPRHDVYQFPRGNKTRRLHSNQDAMPSSASIPIMFRGQLFESPPQVPLEPVDYDDDRRSDTEESNESPNAPHCHSCPANPINRKPIDHMSRDDLRAWRIAQDENRPFEVPHSSLGENLTGRDFVFLFEDSMSMRPHWYDACRLFSEISKFIKHYDKDGMEVYFTVSKDHHRDSKTRTLVEKVVAKQGKLNCSSEPSSALDRIWKSYRDGLRHGKRASLLGKRQNIGLTVYVFTDGIWRRGALTNMKTLLTEIVEFLEKHNCDKKHVGIQFIQFGNGEVETAQLEVLDKDLKQELKRDIVDRESAKGNVWKMLLGTVDDSFDDDEESVCSCQFEPPTSA